MILKDSSAKVFAEERRANLFAKQWFSFAPSAWTFASFAFNPQKPRHSRIAITHYKRRRSLFDQFGFAPGRLPPPLHLIPLTTIPLTFPGLSLRFLAGPSQGNECQGNEGHRP